MAPRFAVFLVLLPLALSACAEPAVTAEPSGHSAAPAVANPEPPVLERLQKTLAAHEASLDELDARREGLEATFFESGPRSSVFESCIRDAGQQDRAMAECEYAEATRLDAELHALLRSDAAPAIADEQSAWEKATKEGCAWSPAEEGTAGELGAAACVTNRLANRIAELRSLAGEGVGHE